MGPRHEGRGRRQFFTDELATKCALQWGHATRGVENTAQPLPLSAWPFTLQWGHATRGVEDLRKARALKPLRKASMGPRHEGRGRQPCPEHASTPPGPLQWGHATR